MDHTISEACRPGPNVPVPWVSPEWNAWAAQHIEPIEDEE